MLSEYRHIEKVYHAILIEVANRDWVRIVAAEAGLVAASDKAVNRRIAAGVNQRYYL
jgi:hypothetical protein